MALQQCTVPGCDRAYRARGFCATHYARWQHHGTHVLPAKTTYTTCTIDGCQRRPRSRVSPYCETHYYRIRRTGSAADPHRISGRCAAAGCISDAAHGDGYCRLHYLRLKNRGDVGFEFTEDNHPGWTGNEATNHAVHQRIKSRRGRARHQLCVDCGKQARHWSYNHEDPHERQDPDHGPYSLNIGNYDPRCVSCHKRFDLAFIRSRRVVSSS